MVRNWYGWLRVGPRGGSPAALRHTFVIQTLLVITTPCGHLTVANTIKRRHPRSATICYGLSTVKAGHPGSCMSPRIEKVAEIRKADLGRGGSSRAASTKNRAE